MAPAAHRGHEHVPDRGDPEEREEDREDARQRAHVLEVTSRPGAATSARPGRSGPGASPIRARERLDVGPRSVTVNPIDSSDLRLVEVAARPSRSRRARPVPSSRPGRTTSAPSAATARCRRPRARADPLSPSTRTRSPRPTPSDFAGRRAERDLVGRHRRPAVEQLVVHVASDRRRASTRRCRSRRCRCDTRSWSAMAPRSRVWPGTVATRVLPSRSAPSMNISQVEHLARARRARRARRRCPATSPRAPTTPTTAATAPAIAGHTGSERSPRPRSSARPGADGHRAAAQPGRTRRTTARLTLDASSPSSGRPQRAAAAAIRSVSTSDRHRTEPEDQRSRRRSPDRARAGPTSPIGNNGRQQDREQTRDDRGDQRRHRERRDEARRPAARA